MILTRPGDFHAYAAALAIREKGGEALLWHTTDFPSRAAESVSFLGGIERVTIDGLAEEGALSAFGTVWNRRAGHTLEEASLHPADRDFADLQCRLFRQSLFDLMARDAFWVNSPEATRRSTKPLQLSAARRTGLTIPETLITNDPYRVRGFVRAHGGQVVFKSLRAAAWKDEETYWFPYTSLLTEDDLAAEPVIRAVPGIYQQLVDKAYEVRATVMGRCVLAARLYSQQSEAGRLDWRRDLDGLTTQPHTMPEQVSERCIELLRRLGLVFGCFDFIVTPEGRYVFLEVNQTGQFLFLDSRTGLPMLDAFSDFLLSGKPDFRYEGTRIMVRTEDVEAEACRWMEAARQDHVQPRDDAWYEARG